MNEKVSIHQMKSFNQSGVALIISLIFLVVSTLLAVSTLSGNVLEEKMARNMLQRHQAFEAAEVALRAGETFVEDDINNVDEWVFYDSSGTDDGDVTVDNQGDACVNGFCTPVRRSLSFDPDNPQGDRWTDAILDVWQTASRHRLVSTAVTADLDLPQQPKYIIEFVRYVPPYDPNGKVKKTNCDLNGNGVKDPTEQQWEVWPYCTLDMKEYRITGVGFAGNSSESLVMLQSVYVSD